MTRIRQARQSARRLFRDCLVGGLLDENLARRVVLHVIEANRRDGAVILSEFHRLARLDRDRHRADVRSASPLPEDMRAQLHARLSRAYGAGLHTSFVTDPSLVGGLRIQVGSDVYDGSVRGRLSALETRMQTGERT